MTPEDYDEQLQANMMSDDEIAERLYDILNQQAVYKNGQPLDISIGSWTDADDHYHHMSIPERDRAILMLLSWGWCVYSKLRRVHVFYDASNFMLNRDDNILFDMYYYDYVKFSNVDGKLVETEVEPVKVEDSVEKKRWWQRG